MRPQEPLPGLQDPWFAPPPLLVPALMFKFTKVCKWDEMAWGWESLNWPKVVLGAGSGAESTWDPLEPPGSAAEGLQH